MPRTSMFTVRLLVGAGVTDMIKRAFSPSMMLVGLESIVTTCALAAIGSASMSMKAVRRVRIMCEKICSICENIFWVREVLVRRICFRILHRGPDQWLRS